MKTRICVPLVSAMIAILLLAAAPLRAQQTEAQRQQQVFAALKTSEGD